MPGQGVSGSALPASGAVTPPRAPGPRAGSVVGGAPMRLAAAARTLPEPGPGGRRPPPQLVADRRSTRMAPHAHPINSRRPGNSLITTTATQSINRLITGPKSWWRARMGGGEEGGRGSGRQSGGPAKQGPCKVPLSMRRDAYGAIGQTRCRCIIPPSGLIYLGSHGERACRLFHRLAETSRRAPSGAGLYF